MLTTRLPKQNCICSRASKYPSCAPWFPPEVLRMTFLKIFAAGTSLMTQELDGFESSPKKTLISFLIIRFRTGTTLPLTMAGQSASSPCLARASRWAPVSSCCCSCCLRTKAWGGHYVVSQNFLCWSCILITKKKWTVKKCATELELPGNRTACPELTPATFFSPLLQSKLHNPNLFDWFRAMHAHPSKFANASIRGDSTPYTQAGGWGLIWPDTAWYGMILDSQISPPQP